jgi:putative membrane protein
MTEQRLASTNKALNKLQLVNRVDSMITNNCKMKRTYLSLAIAAIAVTYSCNDGSTATTKEEMDSNLRANSESTIKNDTAKQIDSGVVPIQNTFATKAVIAGMMEEESGTRMIKSTENPVVQTFAARMVKDHKAANKELEIIAKKLNLKLPTSLPNEKAGPLAKLDQLKGDDKNRFYANLMVKEHDEAVLLFELASQNETGLLKDFALKQLPTLKLHRTHAITVQKMIHDIKK